MCSRLQNYQGIAIYNDPAPAQVGCTTRQFAKVLVFTMIPPLPRRVSRPQSCKSNTIYNDPLLPGCGASPSKLPKYVLLFTMIPPLSQWGVPAFKVTSVLSFTVFAPLPDLQCSCPCPSGVSCFQSYQSIAIYIVHALAQVGMRALEVTKYYH